MAGIELFLEQNPELRGKDRQAVADYVYETQIQKSGKDRDTFNEYFLGAPAAPAEKPGFVSRMMPDFIEKPARALGGMIAGDAEYPDMPDAAEAGLNKSLSGLASAAFGDDKDWMKTLLENHPDLSAGEDANGNAMLMRDGKPVAYVNRPGLDTADVARFTAKAGAFIPAGRAAQAVGRFGMAARASMGAAASGATDAGMQMAAGRDEIDAQQVILTGALGAGSEAVAPVLGRAVGAVAKKFGVDKWSRMTQAERYAEMARQLDADELPMGDLTGMTREQAIEFATKRVHRADVETPGAAMARDEFGFEVSRGRAMPARNVDEIKAQETQLNREEALRSLPDGEGARILQSERNNADNIERLVDDFGAGFSGGRAQGATRNQSAQVAHEGLLRARAASQREVDDAYRVAESFDGEFADEVMLELPNRVKGALERAGVLTDDLNSPVQSLTPAALRVIKELDANPRTTISQVENTRRKINNLLDDTKRNPTDHRAMTIVKQEFDKSISEAIDANLFRGDPSAMEALKKARGIYAQHARKFNTDDGAGKIIKQMLDEDAEPHEIARFVFGSTGLSKNGAGRVVKQYAEAVGGKNTQEFNALRETYLYSIARRKNTDAKGMQAMVSDLKAALGDGGEAVTRELYTPAEIGKLKRFVTAMDAIMLKGDRARSSGTAERLARMASTGYGSVPGVAKLIEIAQGIENGRLIGQSLRASPTPAGALSPLPVVAGGYAAQ